MTTAGVTHSGAVAGRVTPRDTIHVARAVHPPCTPVRTAEIIHSGIMSPSLPLALVYLVPRGGQVHGQRPIRAVHHIPQAAPMIGMYLCPDII